MQLAFRTYICPIWVRDFSNISQSLIHTIMHTYNTHTRMHLSKCDLLEAEEALKEEEEAN